MKGNSSSEHLIVVKTWMKTNEVGEKHVYSRHLTWKMFFDKEGIIDIKSVDKKT